MTAPVWLQDLARRPATRWSNGLSEGDEIVVLMDGQLMQVRVFWCTENDKVVHYAEGRFVLGCVALADEGLSWARGWRTRAADALRVTVALS